MSIVPVAAWLISQFVRAVRWYGLALSSGKRCHGKAGSQPTYWTALCLDRTKQRKILTAFGRLLATVDALIWRKLAQILFGINVLGQRTFLPGSGNLSPANWS
jgi:hypothetical protein